MNTPSVSGSSSFEVLLLAMMLGNGSGTDFGASQCIPMGPYHLTRRLMLRLTLSVVMPLGPIWDFTLSNTLHVFSLLT